MQDLPLQTKPGISGHLPPGTRRMGLNSVVFEHYVCKWQNKIVLNPERTVEIEKF